MRRQAVDLVDEQHVARFEIGEQRGQVACLGDHRPGGRTETDTHLATEDLRQRGLAKTRRAREQHMVKRIAPIARGRDEYFQVGLGGRLPREIVERGRPQRTVDCLAGLAFGIGDVSVSRHGPACGAVRGGMEQLKNNAALIPRGPAPRAGGGEHG